MSGAGGGDASGPWGRAPAGRSAGIHVGKRRPCVFGGEPRWRGYVRGRCGRRLRRRRRRRPVRVGPEREEVRAGVARRGARRPSRGESERVSFGRGRGRPPSRGSALVPGLSRDAGVPSLDPVPPLRGASRRPFLGASSRRKRPRGLAGLAPRPRPPLERGGGDRRGSDPASPALRLRSLASAFRDPGGGPLRRRPAGRRGVLRLPMRASPRGAAGGSRPVEDEEGKGARGSGPWQAPMSRPGGPCARARVRSWEVRERAPAARPGPPSQTPRARRPVRLS